MSFIHNRMGAVMLAVAAAVLLLGAGCGDAKKPVGTADISGAPADGATNAPSDSAGTDGGTITNWATYRSESLGISIPYPEGWYVEEGVDERTVSFYPIQPPPDSDLAPSLWFDTHAGSTAEFVQQLDNIEADDTVERSGRRMRRIVRRDDLSDDAGLAASYLWEVDSITYRIGGRQGDPILEYAVDNLEVLQ